MSARIAARPPTPTTPQANETKMMPATTRNAAPSPSRTDPVVKPPDGVTGVGGAGRGIGGIGGMTGVLARTVPTRSSSAVRCRQISGMAA